MSTTSSKVQPAVANMLFRFSQAWMNCCSFFFNDTATTEIYTLSLHDALPICSLLFCRAMLSFIAERAKEDADALRSEEHTSELQSLRHLVCRLLLEKKKNHFESSPRSRRRGKLWCLRVFVVD